MEALHTIRCVGCEGGIPALTREEANELVKQVPEWIISDDVKSIHREFKFKGFNRTMGFVNAVAWIANQEGHHPDLEIGFDYCRINYTTHAVDGLTKNDFICAAKINRLGV